MHTSSLSLTWMVNNFKMFIKYGHSPDCYMSSGVLSCHKYLETIQAFLSPTPHIQQTLRGLGMVLQGEVHHWPTVGFVSGPTWVAHHKCTPMPPSRHKPLKKTTPDMSTVIGVDLFVGCVSRLITI